MTVDTGLQVATENYVLRARFVDEDALSIDDAHKLIYGLRCLMELGYALADHQRDLRTARDEDLPSYSVSLVRRALAESQVRSIRYNSPLEIVVGVSSAITTIAGTGYVIVGLWDRIQQSRINTSTASTEVMFQQVVKRRLSAALDEAGMTELDKAELDNSMDWTATVIPDIDFLYLEPE